MTKNPQKIGKEKNYHFKGGSGGLITMLISNFLFEDEPPNCYSVNFRLVP
jgi:hypothetical protein